MYDELVKRLREEANGWCSNCCYRCGDNVCGAPDDRKKDCDVASELQAADAIEELSKRVDESIPKGDVEIIIEELSKPKWIPVTERLPEKNQIVVVVQNGKTWDYGRFRGLAYLGGNIHKWNWKNNTTKTVDYWMPKKSALPEPLKEGK